MELVLIQTHMIQKPMLRVEVCTHALRTSQNVKKIDACLLCSLCFSGYMGGFSGDVGWLAFFVWRSPSGFEKDEKCVKRRAIIRYGVEPGGVISRTETKGPLSLNISLMEDQISKKGAICTYLRYSGLAVHD